MVPVFFRSGYFDLLLPEMGRNDLWNKRICSYLDEETGNIAIYRAGTGCRGGVRIGFSDVPSSEKEQTWIRAAWNRLPDSRRTLRVQSKNFVLLLFQIWWPSRFSSSGSDDLSDRNGFR
jgi:hypothetical protein